MARATLVGQRIGEVGAHVDDPVGLGEREHAHRRRAGEVTEPNRLVTGSEVSGQV